MTSTRQIADRFREVFFHGIWIANTNYKDQLSGLDWETVTAQIPPLNTMAVLAQHVHYYVAGLVQAFRNGTLNIKDAYSFDFPPIRSQSEWEAFLAKFWNDVDEFAHLTEQMPERKLDEIFIDEKYGTYRRNIDGMIEHAYYHLGQIVLIKKLIAGKNGDY